VVAAVAFGILAVGGVGLSGILPGTPKPSALVLSGASGSPASPSPIPVPKHEVYGFVPYWEMDDGIAAHIGRTDLTTVALFSVTHATNGAIDETQSGYRRIAGGVGEAIIAAARDRHMRVDLVYTSFGERKNTALFAAIAIQDRVIANLVALVGRLKLDGLTVDVEELDPADIPAWAVFVGRLRAALVADRPKSTLTIATTAGPQGAGMASAAVLAGADRIFLMGYDYRTAGSEPGASAPFERRDGGDRNLRWSLDLYAAAGVPSERLLLGLPLYGMSWPVAGPELGAQQTGPGEIWVPRRNLELLSGATKPEYDPLEAVEFLAVHEGPTWKAIYFDSPASLTPKLLAADERGFAGAGFWAVGYERGLPAYTALIATFRGGRLTAAAATP
jgi:spore germination protein YaaH